jgi:hypothetical protein
MQKCNVLSHASSAFHKAALSKMVPGSISRSRTTTVPRLKKHRGPASHSGGSRFEGTLWILGSGLRLFKVNPSWAGLGLFGFRPQLCAVVWPRRVHGEVQSTEVQINLPEEPAMLKAKPLVNECAAPRVDFVTPRYFRFLRVCSAAGANTDISKVPVGS